MRTELKLQVFVALFFLFLAFSQAQMIPFAFWKSSSSSSSLGSFTIYAGAVSSNVGSSNGSSRSAEFNYPISVAVDSAGNVFVSDTDNCTIRKITSAGIVSTFAGSPGNCGYVDGTGTAAAFAFQYGITFDTAGNLMVADTSNYVIRKITSAGVVSTFAGIGGTETVVPLLVFPQAAAATSAGTVYIADGNAIRVLAPSGAISTLAGSSAAGFNDGFGTNAMFNSPAAIALDSAGNVYVADTGNNAVRKVTPAGVVTTLISSTSNSSPAEFQNIPNLKADAGGNLYYADVNSALIRTISSSGVVVTLAGAYSCGYTDGAYTSASFCSPSDVAVDSSGNIFVADTGNFVIRKMDTSGNVTTFAGSGAQTQFPIFDNPSEAVFDTAGNVYISDWNAHIIRKATASSITTFAGHSYAPGSGNGTGTNAYFYDPGGLAIDTAGNLYVADCGNNMIRKITSAGAVTTLAGSTSPGSSDGTGAAAGFNCPSALAVDNSNNVYVVDSGNNTIRKITSAGVTTTLAGQAGVAGYANGTSASAKFNSPQAISWSNSSVIYVADSGNNNIRKVTTAGVVTTLAGNASSAGFQNGTGTAATFDYPDGIIADNSGNVFVADNVNLAIRKITSAGVVTTFTGGFYGFGDGTGSNAQFQSPYLMSMDASSAIYVSDYNTIRKITTNGIVTTYLGNPNNVGTVDGSLFGDGSSATAAFNSPVGITIDNSANLYVVDGGLIRKITPAGAVTTLAGGAPYGGSLVNGTGRGAEFDFALGIANDNSGNLYVADNAANVIQKITSAGVVTTLAGSLYNCGAVDATGTAARFCYPERLTVDASSNIFVTDTQYNTIRKVTKTGVVTTYAGSSGISGGYADGIGASALFSYPEGIVYAPNGDLYVGDSFNDMIRQITPSGPTVSTFSGNGTYAILDGNSINDGVGGAADLGVPVGITVDSSGNLYISSTNYGVVYKYSAGAVSIYAGNGTPGYVDGPGTVAAFGLPYGLSFDTAGNLYVADGGNNAIRKISPTQAVTTVAGQSSAGYVDGNGTSALFNYPTGVYAAPGGVVYVSDSGNNVIRKINSSSVVSTFAGNSSNYSYYNGPANLAGFYSPFSLTMDGSGNLYVAEPYDYDIRQVSTSSSNVATVAGTLISQYLDGGGVDDGAFGIGTFSGPTDIVAGPNGSFYVTDVGKYYSGGAVRMVSSTGALTTVAGSVFKSGFRDGVGGSALFSAPVGIAYNSSSSVIFVDDTAYGVIKKINSSSVVSLFVGNASSQGSIDGTGAAAAFYTPMGLAVDVSGNLWVADLNANNLRKVSQSSVVTTIAGNASSAGYVDGTGTAASFFGPYFIGLNSGNIYIADSENNLIRMSTSAGVVTTIAGAPPTYGIVDGPLATAMFYGPTVLTVDSSGNFYFMDYLGTILRKISNTGTVTTIAGSAGVFGNQDGTGTGATFSVPSGIVADASGNVYISEYSCIRKVTPAGVVTTIAGIFNTYGFVNGTGSAALFSTLTGLSFDGSGNLMVVDSGNSAIRQVTTAGVVTTVAGGIYGTADGTGSSAQFENPKGIVKDSLGNFYISESGSCRIRYMTSTFTVSTVAGSGTCADVNGTGTSASFANPSYLAIDASNNLYISEGTCLIRKMTPSHVVSSPIGTTGVCVASLGPLPATVWANGMVIYGSTLYVTEGNGIVQAPKP